MIFSGPQNLLAAMYSLAVFSEGGFDNWSM